MTKIVQLLRAPRGMNAVYCDADRNVWRARIVCLALFEDGSTLPIEFDESACLDYVDHPTSPAPENRLGYEWNLRKTDEQWLSSAEARSFIEKAKR